jgi:hypothetical protein
VTGRRAAIGCLSVIFWGCVLAFEAFLNILVECVPVTPGYREACLAANAHTSRVVLIYALIIYLAGLALALALPRKER